MVDRTRKYERPDIHYATAVKHSGTKMKKIGTVLLAGAALYGANRFATDHGVTLISVERKNGGIVVTSPMFGTNTHSQVSTDPQSFAEATVNGNNYKRYARRDVNHHYERFARRQERRNYNTDPAPDPAPARRNYTIREVAQRMDAINSQRGTYSRYARTAQTQQVDPVPAPVPIYNNSAAQRQTYAPQQVQNVQLQRVATDPKPVQKVVIVHEEVVQKKHSSLMGNILKASAASILASGAARVSTYLRTLPYKVSYNAKQTSTGPNGTYTSTQSSTTTSGPGF